MKVNLNKMVKKIWAFLLVIAMVATLMPQTIFAAGTAQGKTDEVDDPVEQTVNADVYFVHSSSKKVITLNGKENDPIDCVNTIVGNNVPNNAKFKIYYGDSEGKEVVNFTCDAVNTSWKAVQDKVFQIAKRTNPAGWESVTIEPQGDGTVAFRSNASNKYFTVGDSILKITDEEKASGDEKFIIHTTTKPKTAKKVTLSEVMGDSVKVSWTGVTQTLYSGYQVLYSKSENTGYTVAGETAGTSFTVEGLDLSTKYYFKVRTITNNEDGPYSDSAVAYTTTLKDYKPNVPKNVKLLENADGSYKIQWDTSRSAKGYEVYKAESRFGTYEKIGEVTNAVTYTDVAPNRSKYKNYYRIKAFNDIDTSDFSEAASVEINMFGENTYIFSDQDNAKDVNSIIENIFQQQHYNQFGTERYALAYKPGDYTKMDPLKIGYYTQILGLGKTPYDVKLNNVRTPAALSGNNATCNFWVGIENLTIADTDNNDGDVYFQFQWAVSQAAPARRLNVERVAVFDWYWGWASGGYVADSYFHKSAGSASQQQYYYRNCYVNDGTYGVNWNQVIQGCEGNTVDATGMTALQKGIGVTDWNQRKANTVIDNTKEIREKPFLYFDTNTDSYKVFIPAIRKNSKGVSWSYGNMGKGTSISVDKYFYIANPKTDTADSINKQLAAGKNIIFQPGVYHVNKPIEVKKANTVILGLGIATIIPDNSDAAIKVSDVGGVSIAGLVLDAGNYSKTLLTVGEEGCNKDHSDNPIVLQDVIYRVGGTGALGRVGSCVVINSNDTIVDHTWIWRADHGDNTGWNQNTAKNGIEVNGDRVTSYGLFCEHFQEYDIIWRGEYGETYFLQNEKCYDPQNQASWMSHNGTKKGYAAYKVTNNVKNHYAVGLGIYDVFINTNGASIYLDNAIEVPDTTGVLIENACIVEIANGSGPKVGINHIINGTTAGIRTGEGNNGGYAIQRLLSYSLGDSRSLEDYYSNKTGTTVIPEKGIVPTNDAMAEKDIKKETSSKDNETPLWNMTEDLFDKKIEDAKTTDPGKTDPGKTDPGKTDPGKTSPGKTSPGKTVSTKLKKGQKFISGKFTYQIISVKGKKGTVKITKVNKKYQKKLKTITVKATIKYKGYNFKITTIGSKAFAKCKKVKKFVVKGKNLKKISKNAFYKKNRKKLKITAKKTVKKKVLKSLKRKK